MNRLGAILLIFFIPLSLFGGLTFEKYYGGSGDDWAHAIVELPDGSFMLIGTTYSFGGNGSDGYLIKTDKYGQKIWEKNVDTGVYEGFKGATLTSEGDIIITGYVKSNESAQPDLLILKIDGAGNILWSKVYGGSGKDVGWDIKTSPDGNYVISGYTNSYGVGGEDVWILKINAAGDTLWTQTVGGTNNDSGRGLVIDTAGNIYVSANSFFLFAPDMYMIKLDPQGNRIWSKTISTLGWTEGYDVCLNGSGNGAAFAGYGYWSFGYSHDMFLVTVNANGDTLNTVHGGGSYDDYAYTVCLTDNKGYLLAGKTKSFGYATDALLWKVDSSGTSQWYANFGGTDEDMFWDVIETSDHFYAAVGYTKSFGNGQKDVYFVKTDTEGRLSDIVSKPETISNNFSLFQNYPNPFNPSTTISFSLTRSCVIRLSVYNSLGQLIKVLKKGKLTAGIYEVTWDGTDADGHTVPTGIYFYKLSTSTGFQKVRKMLLLR